MKINFKDYNRNEIIRIFREWTELTQKDFAKRINKSKRTVEDYESGKINYNIDTLLTISREFDIEIKAEKKKN